jgi:hypothetical protein
MPADPIHTDQLHGEQQFRVAGTLVRFLLCTG